MTSETTKTLPLKPPGDPAGPERFLIPARLIKAIVPFCAKEQMRYALKCMRICRVDKSLRLGRPAVRMAATDGRALCIVDLSTENREFDLRPVFDAILLDRWESRYIGIGDLVEIVDGRLVVWTKIGGTSTAPEFSRRIDLVHQPEGMFPNLEAVITSAPSDDDMKDFYGNPGFMMRSAKAHEDVRKFAKSEIGVRWASARNRSQPMATYFEAPLAFKVSERHFNQVRIEMATYLMPLHEG